MANALETEPLGRPLSAAAPNLARPLPRTGAGPVFWRELRSEAKGRGLRVLRLISAIGVAVWLGWLLRNGTQLSPALNLRLFASGHAFIVVSLWVLCPILTSDAVARERRAGTLPLLFSTPLRAQAVIAGKGGLHLARALTPWIAAIPVMVVPVVFGGITWLDIGTAAAVELSFALIGLACGLVASAWVRRSVGALLTAELLAFGMVLLLLPAVAGLSWIHSIPLPSTPSGAASPPIFQAPFLLFTGGWNGKAWSGKLAVLGASGTDHWLSLLAEWLLLAGCLTLLLVKLASLGTAARWQDAPLTLAQERRRQLWLSPRFWRTRLSSERSALLDQNPLGWLQQHSARARTSLLLWCGLVLFCDGLVLSTRYPWERFNLVQGWLAVGLALQMTFTAVTLFREGRETGALELLLVTPLGAGRLLRGQFGGFWRRYLPPLLLLLLMTELFLRLDLASACTFNSSIFILVTYLVAPLTGFYASARFGSPAPAFLFASFITLALPFIAAGAGPGIHTGIDGLDLWLEAYFPTVSAEPPQIQLALYGIQLLAASLCGYWLWRGLSRRTFVLAKAR